MRTRRTRAVGLSLLVVASVAALTRSFGANPAQEPDQPTGEITLMAPCEAEEHPFEVKKLVSNMRSTFKLGAEGTVFASSARATAVADATHFILVLKVEQSGKVVSTGQMQTMLNKGESGNLATLCAVIPAQGTYTVSADVRVVGSAKALDSRNCQHTAP